MSSITLTLRHMLVATAAGILALRLRRVMESVSVREQNQHPSK
jgi:hypothetical protein